MEQILQGPCRIHQQSLNDKQMKKILISLTAFCLLGLCAGAQNSWWLFPGKKKAQKKSQADTTAFVKIDSVITSEDLIVAADTLDSDELWLNAFSDELNVSLILPLKASDEKPSSNFLEMYSGALMAVRDLGRSGIRVNLRVYDSAAPGFSLDGDLVSGQDVVIGPVEYEGLQTLSAQLGRGRAIVSPLEPKAAGLTVDGRLIQSPVPWTRQIDEMVDWLIEETMAGDEVVVIRDVSVQGNGEQSAYLISRLQQAGVMFRSISSAEELSQKPLGKYRLMIASDNDAFITKAVRGIGIASTIQDNIVLYSSSRVRNCVGPDVFDLYTANTRLCASYFIDYEDPAVKDFIIAYRSLMQSEPGSFAFQGYDTVRYYVAASARFGRRWARRLPEYSHKGLQSDFRFDYDVADGKQNIAVRRIVYRPDLTVSLL